MPIHVFVRFEPLPGKQTMLLAELTRVLEPTRAEPGCIRIRLYEATRSPLAFYIHSEWIDEQAFEAHAELPHTQRLIAAVGELIAHPSHAARTKQIG